MAREPEVLGRRVSQEMGAWRPFANMKDDKSRLLYLLVAVNTVHDRPITEAPHRWPEIWPLMQLTGADCGKAAIDWVVVGAAEWTNDGLLLTSPELGKAKVRRATGKWISDEDRDAIYERDMDTCRYCGARRDVEEIKDTFALDHIVPRSQGGSDDEGNLVTACQSCNSSKGARTPEQANMRVLPMNEVKHLHEKMLLPEWSILRKLGYDWDHEEHLDYWCVDILKIPHSAYVAARSKLARAGAIRRAKGNAITTHPIWRPNNPMPEQYRDLYEQAKRHVFA